MKIGNSWDNVLSEEFGADYFLKLSEFIENERQSHNVFPCEDEMFTAFKLCDFDKVKVVIFGQDPYHEIGQAHGLAFSVKEGIKVPPSLKNIHKELETEFGFSNTSGTLTKWAEQGVLMLNAVLTVRESEANSHKNKGWEMFTDKVVKALGEREEPTVFLLWGANARSKKKFVKNKNHLVLECAHPSPLSAYRGFFGCGHFKQTNEFLAKNGQEKIDWQL